MPQPLRSEPDPSEPTPSATKVLPGQLEDLPFEADLAALAGSFAAQSEEDLPVDLSHDLAFEIMLNEVVEQACLTTGAATSAAIVLLRSGEMVCRGSSGSAAPVLGSRVDEASGLPGECIRTHRTQRCNDVWADPRMDLDASQRLGVRSVMVMPLLRGAELVGLFELFSSLPHAFGEREELALEVLVADILGNLEPAVQPLPQRNEPVPNWSNLEHVAEPLPSQYEPVPDSGNFESTAQPPTPQNLPVSVSDIHDTIPEAPEPRRSAYHSKFDISSWALTVAVLVCAISLGLLLGHHPGQKAKVQSHPLAPHPIAPLSATVNARSNIRRLQDASPLKKPESANTSATPDPFVKTDQKPAPSGSLLIFQNGREIFRMPPVQNQTGQNQPMQLRSSEEQVAETQLGQRLPNASLAEKGSGEEGSVVRGASSRDPEKVVDLSPAVAEGGVLYRVEPEYPEEARQQRIQGKVVLEVHIGRDGAVQDVQIISGPPKLTRASTTAVKRWLFQPRLKNGRAAVMETRITLNFSLPQ